MSYGANVIHQTSQKWKKKKEKRKREKSEKGNFMCVSVKIMHTYKEQSKTFRAQTKYYFENDGKRREKSSC